MNSKLIINVVYHEYKIVELLNRNLHLMVVDDINCELIIIIIIIVYYGNKIELLNRNLHLMTVDDMNSRL